MELGSKFRDSPDLFMLGACAKIGGKNMTPAAVTLELVKSMQIRMLIMYSGSLLSSGNSWISIALFLFATLCLTSVYRDEFQHETMSEQFKRFHISRMTSI